MSEPSTSGSLQAVPSGYRLVMPPGWVHIPLREGTAEALERLLFSRLREVPSEVPKDEAMAYRLKVRRDVETQVAKAREANGLDLYVPVELAGLRYGIPLAASVLVTEFVTEERDPGPEVILSRLAAGTADNAVTDTMEIAETLAVRRAYVRPAAPEQGVSVAGRHVEYALALPYDSRRYLVVSFATAGDGDPESEFSDALAELFDAVMGTFRWSHGESDALSRQTNAGDGAGGRDGRG